VPAATAAGLSGPANPLSLIGAGPAVLMGDISEFQPDLADAAYRRWSPALIIRAMYGLAHDDAAWFGGARRSAWLKAGGEFLGIYQYLVASQDAAAQAHALVGLIGDLKQGTEIPIMDDEEGSPGLQAGRRAQWMAVMMQAYPWLASTPVGRAWDYSGLSFSEAAGFEPVWLADYTSAEPSRPHRLWQFTDAFQIPGLPARADCSIWHGTIAQLKALITPASQPKPPATASLVATRGNEPLRAFAHNHGMTVQQVLWWTARLKDGGYGTPGQAAYVSAGAWDADVPAGVTWGIGPTP
jgi:hypothetical protein